MSGLLAASFTDESALLAAMREARARGFRVHEVFTPYPVHGLDEVLGVRRSRLAWVTLAGGLAGLVGAVALQVWGAVIDWPLNVGGKPANSALAFLPISFEATVLVGGLATAAAFFWRSRLGPRAKPWQAVPGTTDDALVAVLEMGGDPEALRELMLTCGARDLFEKGAP